MCRFVLTQIDVLVFALLAERDRCRANWRTLLALAVIHGIDVGLENFSIVYISISSEFRLKDKFLPMNKL